MADEDIELLRGLASEEITELLTVQFDAAMRHSVINKDARDEGLRDVLRKFELLKRLDSPTSHE